MFYYHYYDHTVFALIQDPEGNGSLGAVLVPYQITNTLRELF